MQTMLSRRIRMLRMLASWMPEVSIFKRDVETGFDHQNAVLLSLLMAIFF